MSLPWPPPAPGTRWLLRLPNWIGDAIMVLPALRALPREGQVWGGVAHPRVLPLYRASGGFRDLWPARGADAPRALWGPLRDFRPRRAVVFTTAPSGAVLARASGAERRLGRGGLGRRLLLTDLLPPRDRAVRLWKDYAEIAGAAGGELAARPDFRLDPGDAAEESAKRLLRPLGSRAPVALAPGAAYGSAKRWPSARFADLARALAGRGEPVVAVGGENERDLGRVLAEAGALDLTGRTGLLESVAVLARSRVLVSNDSGALHLGRAAGTRVIGLFGSSAPDWTGPEPQEGEAVWTGIPCSPCFRRECPLEGGEHLRCLRGIEVEDVLARVGTAA